MENFVIERVRNYGAEIAIVLSSGLNSLVLEAASQRPIPYHEVAELPRSTVKGHSGRFVLGEFRKRASFLRRGGSTFTKVTARKR